MSKGATPGSHSPCRHEIKQRLCRTWDMTFFQLDWLDASIVVKPFESTIMERIAAFLGLPLHSPRRGVQEDLSLERSGANYSLRSSILGMCAEFSSVDDLIVHGMTALSNLFLRKTAHLVLHSGAFVSRSEAILFSGLPHAGKSAFGLSAWLEGRRLINDDLLVYESATHQVRSFPKSMKPRLNSITVPAIITERAGTANVVVGRFLHDIGAFISRGASGMAGYDETYPIKAFLHIERGETTALMRMEQKEALVSTLLQTLPNANCLKIVPMVASLAGKKQIYRLIIGNHDQINALDKVEEALYGAS